MNTPSGLDRQATILIVDDTTNNLYLVASQLEDIYRVKIANHGIKGLKIATSEPHPDLILLDVMMPEVDGYEVCRQLKGNPVTRDIPVIFLTALNEADDELKGLELGAVDYITKPTNTTILRARIKTHLTLKAMQQALELRNQDLLLERKLVEDILLKMRTAYNFHDRYLRYLISPVERTNGDLLLSTTTPDQRQLLFVGDFTGHGLPAAIGGPLVSYIFYQLAQQGRRGGEIFREINTQLQLHLPVSMFLAACLVEVLPQRNSFNLWNAAMPNAMLIRQGQVVREFLSAAPPLGIVPVLAVDKIEAVFGIERGDRLFVYSDGVIESRSPTGEMFGKERLADLLFQIVEQKASLDTLLTTLDEYCATSDHDDDITLVELLTGNEPV